MIWLIVELFQYKYSSTKDRVFIAIGVIGAIVTGLTTPANTLIFGNLVNVSNYIKFTNKQYLN